MKSVARLCSVAMTDHAKCSLFLPQAMLSYAQLLERTRLVEKLGYEGMWVVDHMWAGGMPELDFLEGWTAIAGLAAQTQRLRLGVLVTCNSYRNPGMLAKSVATADHISAGRIELGIGAGWMEAEYRAYGYDFPSIGVRLAQLEESLEIITQLFTRERTSFAGKHYTFTDAPFAPKPVQEPLPITIGGGGTRVLMRLVARYAARWNCPMPTAVRLTEHLEALAAHCDAIGRDPSEITIGEQVAVVLGRDDADLKKQTRARRAHDRWLRRHRYSCSMRHAHCRNRWFAQEDGRGSQRLCCSAGRSRQPREHRTVRHRSNAASAGGLARSVHDTLWL